MKKITLFTFLFLIITTFAFAQINNGSFENWTTYPSGSYPTGWTTSDSAGMGALCGGLHNAVQVITPKCDGNYAIKLNTWTCLGQIIPGTITNGIIGVGLTGVTINGGAPYTVRNDSLTGCFEYTPSGSGNIAVISAILYKRNGTTGARDIIAAAYDSITAASSMASFSIPFVYADPDPSHLPDSILIVCSSSSQVGAPSVAGSILIVDNLKLKGILSGIIPVNGSGLKDLKVGPMPADEYLNVTVDLNKHKSVTYELIDGLGRVVANDVLSEKQKINTGALSNGIYFLNLLDQSGVKLSSTKVTVAH